jgi:uncharacterized Zn-finger protein
MTPSPDNHLHPHFTVAHKPRILHSSRHSPTPLALHQCFRVLAVLADIWRVRRPSTAMAPSRPSTLSLLHTINNNAPLSPTLLSDPYYQMSATPTASSHLSMACLIACQCITTVDMQPFRCDQCPQSFNRNHDLKRHKRIHLAVKPFPCGHCDKSFSRKDALKVCSSHFYKLKIPNAHTNIFTQRHVLVKGCGKAHATTEVKEIDGSSSPDMKSEHELSPVVTASA